MSEKRFQFLIDELQKNVQQKSIIRPNDKI